ncbi:hypothetical protein pb186bvf_013620 [Paramecium bursaria]
MFNVFKYDQQVKLSKEIDKIKKDYLKEREVRKDQNNRFAQNYKKRVENFVITMLENPIVYNDYTNPTVEQFRIEDPSKNVGDPQIYVKGFKHEKDRIREALEKNKDLDFLPNQSVANHVFRERDPSKDVKRDIFRFKDKTSLERIEQYLKDHTQTQVENMKFNKKKLMAVDNLSENMSPQDRKAYISRQIAKNLLPSLHNKTHFQAAASMFNNLPLSIMDHTRSAPLIKQQIQGQDEEGDGRKKKIQQPEDLNTDKAEKLKSGNELETFNPVETSKQVLEKCNVIKKKNPKVPVIRPGEGHLISTLDRSISELYKEIYNIDITQRQMLQTSPVKF